MRPLIPSVLLCAAACGITFQPHGGDIEAGELRGVDMVTATFEVTCDSCRVLYGPERATSIEVVEGAWQGSAYLGTIVEGDEVLVVLSVQPFGETWVGGAAIRVNSRTVASDEGDEAGDAVYLRVRVGPR